MQALNQSFLAMGLALCLPLGAHAASTVDLQVNDCTGPTTTEETTDQLRLTCDGNWTLSMGVLSSDKKIYLQAKDSITLTDVRLHAPGLEITSNQIMVGAGVQFDVPDTIMVNSLAGGTPPSVNLASGATLLLNGGGRALAVQPRGLDSVMLVGAPTVALTPGTISIIQAPEAVPTSTGASASRGGGGALDVSALLMLLGLLGATVAIKPRHA